MTADPEAPYGRKLDGTPKKMPVTHPDHPLYKPALGKPARSVKGDKGGASVFGAGLHGPANGPGAPLITSETTAELNRLRSDPDEKAGRAARAELMTRKMEDLAMTAELEQTQLAAAIAAANRLGGSPRQAVELGGPEGAGLVVKIVRFGDGQ